METPQVIASGDATSGTTITVHDRTRKWMFCSSADASVTLDGRYTVHLPAFLTNYITVEGDYQTATIASNTVQYIVFG